MHSVPSIFCTNFGFFFVGQRKKRVQQLQDVVDDIDSESDADTNGQDEHDKLVCDKSGGGQQCEDPKARSR